MKTINDLFLADRTKGSVASVCRLYGMYCGYTVRPRAKVTIEPIGSRIWEIDWYQNEWHWPSFRGRIKVMSTTVLHSALNISETVRDRGLVPKDY